MNFEKSIASFLSSKKQRNKLREHYSSMFRRGGTGGIASGMEDAIAYANEAKRFIIASLPDSLKGGSSRPIGEDDLLIGIVETTQDGNFVVHMGWNPEAVHRNSLYEDSDKYKDGIEDIVHLFAVGYRAKTYAYGWWDGHSGRYSLRGTENSVWIRSKISRDPSPFLQAAVAAFNSTYKKDNVKLVLDENYLIRK